MQRRQTSLPRDWLIADERLRPRLWELLAAMPRGSGVVVLFRDMPKRERARLVERIRRIARRRGLQVADEAAGETVRVHDRRELRQAGTNRVPLVLLSPLYPTRSHPGWKPLPRMRAALLARLSTVPVIALGGMDARRFRRVQRLGFSGWAGIDAWN